MHSQCFPALFSFWSTWSMQPRQEKVIHLLFFWASKSSFFDKRTFFIDNSLSANSSMDKIQWILLSVKYDQQNAKIHKSLYVDFVKVIKYLGFSIVIRHNLKEKVHLSWRFKSAYKLYMSKQSKSTNGRTQVSKFSVILLAQVS